MASRQHKDPRADQSSSLFFSKFPGEVRSIIYRECFAGSKARVTPENHPRNNINRHSSFNKAYLPRNEQLELLLTCQDFHDEARPIYWKETAVECAYFSLQKNLSAIPLHARSNIRILEGVPPVDSFARHPYPLDQFLRHFPQLVYCQLRHQSVYIHCLHDKASNEDLLKASGSNAFQIIARALNPRRPPVLVQRAYVNSRICTQRVDWAYINHTTGKVLAALRGSVADEEGFSKVIGPVAEADDVPEADETEHADDSQDANDPHDTHHVQETKPLPRGERCEQCESGIHADHVDEFDK